MSIEPGFHYHFFFLLPFRKGKWDEDDFEDEEDYEDMEDCVDVGEAGRSKDIALPPKHPAQQALPAQRPSMGADRPGLPHNAHPQIQDHGDWTYEEQFKQVGDLIFFCKRNHAY